MNTYVQTQPHGFLHPQPQLCWFLHGSQNSTARRCDGTRLEGWEAGPVHSNLVEPLHFGRAVLIAGEGPEVRAHHGGDGLHEVARPSAGLHARAAPAQQEREVGGASHVQRGLVRHPHGSAHGPVVEPVAGLQECRRHQTRALGLRISNARGERRVRQNGRNPNKCPA